MAITPEHRAMLLGSAITNEVIDASGIESTPTGIRFPWDDGLNPTVWQMRPDVPNLNEDGKPVKYVFPKGAKVPFHRLRDGETYTRVIIAEGTKQRHAVLSHAPADFAVYGMSGCWGYKHGDLSIAADRDVFLLLDADIDSNPDVWAAAEMMTKRLKLNGAKSVAYVATTGEGKEGVDDVLAALPEARRAPMLRTWLAAAPTKLPRRPKAKRPEADSDSAASKYFRVRDKPLHLQPADFVDDLLANVPAALTKESNIALYSNGVYQVDEDAFLSKIVTVFGNYFTPGILANVNMVARGRLGGMNARLPERLSEPLLNCPNGMVDLRTGELLPHDPSYMSHVQVSVNYNADMPTPAYDAWLKEALRQEGAGNLTVDALIADIEETAATMLDPTRTPSKALFLFGPSRSGKSTFLRLLKAIAGAMNTSAVTLHDLAGDQFAAANLYGRMLNVAADLSSAHVSDLSLFKMITGEDVIKGNRKYGKQFEFTNQALIAFSANELPTVSEASRAYAERMKPFEFPNSFAGREDKTLEAKLMAELPGILARWVKAYGRFLTRGGYGQTDAVTQSQFEAKSDRVVQFFQDMCTTTDAVYGQRLPDAQCTGRRDVSEAFNAWAERNGGSKMGERAFFQRLAQITGVTEVKRGSGSRAYNLVVAKADDDKWSEDGEPQPDPIPASGVVSAGDPWGTEQLADAAPVYADAEPESEPQTGAQSFADPFADPFSDPFAV